MKTRVSRRTAFTLIELLVVIGIIAVLIGLLLPAVMQVREAVNRLSCRNNLKQIALAVHNYEGVHSRFPVNTLAGEWGPYDASKPNWSWLARLLPYLEQDNLYRQGKIPNNTLAQSRDVIATPVKLFFCPSDSSASLGPRKNLANQDDGLVALTNYKGVSGANWNWGDARWHNLGSNGSQDGLNHGDGLFYRSDWREPKSLIGITDGTSSTFLVGEDVPEFTMWNAWAHANGASPPAPSPRTPSGPTASLTTPSTGPTSTPSAAVTAAG